VFIVNHCTVIAKINLLIIRAGLDVAIEEGYSASSAGTFNVKCSSPDIVKDCCFSLFLCHDNGVLFILSAVYLLYFNYKYIKYKAYIDKRNI
jgi:hypothetical protein